MSETGPGGDHPDGLSAKWRAPDAPTPEGVTHAGDLEECRGVTTDAGLHDGSEQLETVLDEVINHLRDELLHGEWPAAPMSGR
ncbi:hypothetical protein GCM10027448_34390 [Nocardioides dilutus]